MATFIFLALPNSSEYSTEYRYVHEGSVPPNCDVLIRASSVHI